MLMGPHFQKARGQGLDIYLSYYSYYLCKLDTSCDMAPKVNTYWKQMYSTPHHINHLANHLVSFDISSFTTPQHFL